MSDETKTQAGGSGTKRVALLIELPSFYTADIDELREFGTHHETESDFLLDIARLELGAVRLRVEVAGEKDSSVEEVWGLIREAQLVEPSPGGDEDRVAELGAKLVPDDA